MKILVVFLVGVAMGGLVFGAAVWASDPEEFLRDIQIPDMERSLIISGHAWPDEDGRPSGLSEEYWKSVNEDFGIIWKPVADGPDKGILVIREGELWREMAIESSAAYEFLGE